MQTYHSKPVSYSDIYRSCQWQLLPNAWRYKRTRHWQLILYTLVCRKNDCNHFSDCNHFITSVFFLSLIYFSFPYSSSDTASHHSFEVSSPGTISCIIVKIISYVNIINLHSRYVLYLCCIIFHALKAYLHRCSYLYQITIQVVKPYYLLPPAMCHQSIGICYIWI